MCFYPVGPAFPEHFFQILGPDIRQIKKIQPLGWMSIRSFMAIITFQSIQDNAGNALLIEL